MRRCLRSQVYITQHARDRWEEYGGKGPLTGGKVQRNLQAALRVGLDYVNDAVEVEIQPGFWAVCVPQWFGGWAVVTIVVKDRTEDHKWWEQIASAAAPGTVEQVS